MENFKIRYAYDGYRFYDVISAETPEDACEYCKHLKRDGISRIISCEETTEQAELVATQEELKRIRTPFWKKEGAESKEEWNEYCEYIAEIEQKLYEKFVENHPIEDDPEDFLDEITADVTIEEWRNNQKNFHIA